LNAYSVLKAGAAVKEMTFAHEIGHNLGADHAAGEPASDDQFQEPAYAHGYTDVAGGFRTIMSYGRACAEEESCPKVPYFSTPLVKIDPSTKGWSLTGRPAGNSTSSNNARRIREESGPVSGYHSLKCPGNKGSQCSFDGGGDGGGDENPPPVVK
jgi:hypothetical protein